MKNLPVRVPIALGFLAVILSVISLGVGLERSRANAARQAELLKKQTVIQELNETIALQKQETGRQAAIIETGAKVTHQFGPPILREVGYLAAKNKNEQLRKLLVRHKLETYLLTNEQLEEEERKGHRAR